MKKNSRDSSDSMFTTDRSILASSNTLNAHRKVVRKDLKRKVISRYIKEYTWGSSHISVDPKTVIKDSATLEIG